MNILDAIRATLSQWPDEAIPLRIDVTTRTYESLRELCNTPSDPFPSIDRLFGIDLIKDDGLSDGSYRIYWSDNTVEIRVLVEGQGWIGTLI